MTWIRTVPPDAAPPDLLETYMKLRGLYPKEYATPVPALLRDDGKADSIVAAHSLIPEAMWHMMAGLAVVLRDELGLNRRQQEMIATVVSVRNSCFY